MKNIKIFILLVFIFLTALCQAQPRRYAYYLDENLRSVPQLMAVLYAEGSNDMDLFRLNCYLKDSRKMLIIAYFKDSTLSLLEGPFTSFYTNGQMENQGNYSKGKEDETWQKWDSSGRKTDSIEYKNGIEFTKVIYQYNKNGQLVYHSIKDSLTNTYNMDRFDSSGTLIQKAFFMGTRGLLTRYINGVENSDSVFSINQTDATFPGGISGWTNYLKHNLNAGTPAENGAPNGTFSTIIKFIINEDGSITDVKPETAFGFGMEAEAIRIIKSGPKWIPAEQFGFKVKAYRRQPITYLVAGQ